MVPNWLRYTEEAVLCGGGGVDKNKETKAQICMCMGEGCEAKRELWRQLSQ